ncbi:MAG: pantetheine-phosphate adenylyltransferase [Candidatus Methylacidiphilales bacterium]
MRRAIYPGSFDPVTNGHLDIAERALLLFDEVVLAVAQNQNKTPFFSLEERVALLEQSVSCIKGHERLKITRFDGLLVHFASANQAVAVIRGLRAVSDFEFEFQLALMNRKLDEKVETLFLMPRESYTYLSSRMILEISRLGGNVGEFVPSCVESALKERHHR